MIMTAELDLKRFKIFDGLTEEQAQEILAASTVKKFSAGQTICRQDDVGREMFFILSGQARITVVKPDDDRPVVLNTLGPGSHFGDMSLLISAPRSATATALVDLEVAELDQENFQRVVATIPGFAANLSRTLGVWLRGQLSGQEHSSALRSVGIVHTSEQSRRLGPAIVSAITAVDPSVRVYAADPAIYATGAQPLPRNTAADGRSIPALAEFVDHYSHTLVDLDAADACPQQLLQCERVWFVIDRDADVSGAVRRLADWTSRVPQLASRLQIVEQHERSERLPEPMNETLTTAGVTRAQDTIRIQRNVAGSSAGFHGYRPHDIARFQHQLQGVKLGLVLGGGGAKGMAHLGVIRILEQQGLYFDTIAGTSAGGIIACAYASGMEVPDVLRLLNREMTPSRWFRLMPRGNRASLFCDFRYGRIETKLRKYLHDYDLQQLLLPVSTVAVDLVSGRQIVSTAGDVVQAIRASANHPVFGAPIMRDGMALVDGGVLNNVPATVLRQQGADYVLSIDVGTKLNPKFGKPAKSIADEIERRVSYVGSLMRVLEIIQKGHSVASIEQSDYVITPDTSDFPFEDFTRMDELTEAGRVAATEALPEFLDDVKPWLTKAPVS